MSQYPTAPAAGDPASDLWLIQGTPSADDVWRKAPFSGNPGHEFAKMMHENGLLFEESRRVCVLPERRPTPIWTSESKEAKAHNLPKRPDGYFYSDEAITARDALRGRIWECQPQVVVPVDDFALWALIGESSINKWRGSQIALSKDIRTICIPTYSGAQIFRMWEWRSFAVRDLKRVADTLRNPGAYAYPAYAFAIEPTLPGVMQTLEWLRRELEKGELRIACDIETIARHIACIGLAWSSREALCIPLLNAQGLPYWNYDEEVAIHLALRNVLTHPNAYVVGQNFNYDNQHFAKHLGYLPRLRFDTMLGHHVLFPGIPKSLDVLSSLYAHFHLYWKDELKDYKRMPEDVRKFWTYNCKDCVITWEISIEIEKAIDAEHMREQSDFLHALAEDVLFTMLKGIAVNQRARSVVTQELIQAIEARKQVINTVIGREFNIGSPKQMQEFFYDELGLHPQHNRKTNRVTCDGDALTVIAQRQPLLAPLVELINETRSLGVFLSTFCLMPLDSDSRMRTMFNVAGPETFRFSSSENAFGNGGNLQNIPKGEEE